MTELSNTYIGKFVTTFQLTLPQTGTNTIEGKDVTILWDFEIHTDREI